MTCKDCLHNGVCGGFTPTDLDRDVFDYCRYGRTDEIPDIEERCNSFKDKSRFIELPCKVGDKVYFGTSQMIHEGIVVLIRPFVHAGYTTFHGNVEYECYDPFFCDGRMMKHQIFVVFQKYGADTVAYLSREEAEKALAEVSRK